MKDPSKQKRQHIDSQASTQIPLWELCTKSLDKQTTKKEIKQFLNSLKPQRIQFIQKNVIISRVLNLFILVQIATFNQLFSDKSEFGIRQYLFFMFVVFKFAWFGQKREKPQNQLVKLSQQHSIRQSFGQKKGFLSNLFERNKNPLELMGETALLFVSYLFFWMIQEYLYIPSCTRMVLFTIMILFDQDNDKSSFKLSQLILLSYKFNSYWVGLCSLRTNNCYDLVFEKESIKITEEQGKIKKTEIILAISAGLMLLQFNQESFIWSVYLLFVWIFLNLIEKIDKDCISLKKKYKDEGLMVQIPQYH